MKQPETPHNWEVPQRQSPAAIFILLLKTSVTLLKAFWPALLILFFRKREEDSNLNVLYIVLGFAVLTLITTILNYLFYKFHIRDGNLVINSGFFKRKTLTLPLKNIMAVHLEQNLWQQVLKVVRVSMDSAGSEKMEDHWDEQPGYEIPCNKVKDRTVYSGHLLYLNGKYTYMKKSVALIICCLLFLYPRAQSDYSNYQQQTSRLRTLADRHKDIVSLASIARTPGGKDIWMLTLGSKNASSTPAIAIIGGTEGNHLIGTEAAIGFAEELMKKSKDSVLIILAKTTFYIFPNMSPDAMEQYFAPIRYERQGNATSTDDDRDGKSDEDGFEDLNGDGLITVMRVESPIGEYRVNPQDVRSIMKADLTKGETGKYNIYSEGRDNDKDGTFNEDGVGGVWFNKSLTYNYPAFTPGAGEFAVSQPEARGLLDKLYELFNVYAVVSFSSGNNLSEPYKFNKGATSQRIITGYFEPDAKINAVVSDLYIKKTGLKDVPKTESEGGDLLSWAYYHYGRFSFGTPVWSVPKTKPDTTKKEKPLADSVADLAGHCN